MTATAFSMRLAPVWLIGVLSIGPSAAQQCGGVELTVDTDERRCLRAGAGERFQDCPDCPEMVVAPARTFAMGSYPLLRRGLRSFLGLAFRDR